MIDTFKALDTRSRMLVILAAVTAVMTVLAFFSVEAETERRAPEIVRAPLFPDLSAVLPTAARLEITTRDAAIRIEVNETGDWVLPDKDGFPARLAPVRRVLEGLRSLETVALKTANPDWHEALSLRAPQDGGDGTLVRLTTADGAVLAELLVGSEDQAGTIAGQTRVHVRRPGEDQTWLASGSLAVETDMGGWLRAPDLAMPREAVKTAVIAPGEGRTYRLERADEAAPSFTIAGLAPDQAPTSTYAVNAAAGVLGDLTIDDVRPRGDLTVPDTAPAVVLEGFDGVTVTARLIRAADGDWLIADASGAEDQAVRIEEINELASRFAFKVPPYTANQFAKPLADLVTSQGDSAAGTAP